MFSFFRKKVTIEEYAEEMATYSLKTFELVLDAIGEVGIKGISESAAFVYIFSTYIVSLTPHDNSEDVFFFPCAKNLLVSYMQSLADHIGFKDEIESIDSVIEIRSSEYKKLIDECYLTEVVAGELKDMDAMIRELRVLSTLCLNIAGQAMNLEHQTQQSPLVSLRSILMGIAKMSVGFCKSRRGR